MRDSCAPDSEAHFTLINPNSETWHSSPSRDTISVVLPTIYAVSPYPKHEVHEKEGKRTKVKNFTPMNLSQVKAYSRLEDYEPLGTNDDYASQEIIAFNTVTHDPGWISKSPTIPSRLKYFKTQRSRLGYQKPYRNSHHKSVDISDMDWIKSLPSNLLPIMKKMSKDESARKNMTPNPTRESQVLRYERKEQDSNILRFKSIVSPSKTPSLKSKKEQLMKKVKKTWTPAPKKLFEYKDKNVSGISPERNGISHQICFSPDVKILNSIVRWKKRYD